MHISVIVFALCVVLVDVLFFLEIHSSSFRRCHRPLPATKCRGKGKKKGKAPAYLLLNIVTAVEGKKNTQAPIDPKSKIAHTGASSILQTRTYPQYILQKIQRSVC